MTKRAVLILHGPDEPDDFASLKLKELGYTLEWKHCYNGDTIGKPDESVAVTVLYGGGFPQDEADWHTDKYPCLAVEAQWVKDCIDAGIPTVGFCLGGQIISHALGGKVRAGLKGQHEWGYYEICPTEAGKDLFPEPMVMPEAHYHEFVPPEEAEVLATSELYDYQAYRVGDKTYGFQFHPERSPDGFKRWQKSDWAAFGKPGAQTKEQQDALMAEHSARQKAWIDGFFERLVGPA